MFTVDEGQHRAQSKVWDSKGTKAICYYDDKYAAWGLHVYYLILKLEETANFESIKD